MGGKIDGDGAIKDAEARLGRLNEILLLLSHIHSQGECDFATGVRSITEIAAEVLEVQRAGCWLFDEAHQHIERVDLFDAANNTHESAMRLPVADYPRYFAALESGRGIAAEDALSDPRTSEFAERFLRRDGVTSKIDVPILTGGISVGILCFEHSGSRRRWTADERVFAAWLGDLVGRLHEETRRTRIERALHDREARLQIAINQIPGGMWTTDLELRFTWTVGQAMRDLGMTDQQLVGSSLEDLFPVGGGDASISAHRRACKGESVSYAQELGGLMFQAYVEPLRNEHGEIVGCIGVAINVTERRKAESALRETEAHLRAVADHLPGVIYSYDRYPDGTRRLLFLGPGLESLIGPVSAAHVEAHFDTMFDLIHPEDRPQVKTLAAQGEEAGETVDITCRLKCDDGSWRWVRSASRPMRLPNGNTRWHIVLLDVSEQKRAEEALRQSELQYRQLVESVHLIAWEFDLALNRFTFVSKQAEVILGYQMDAWLQPGFWYEHLHPDDREAASQFSREQAEGHDEFRFESRMIAADGRVVWFKSLGSVQRNEGRPIALRGVMIDITDRKIAEIQLCEKTALAELLVRELDHRIRNNLSTLLSLMDMTRRTTKSKEQFTETVRGRVQAMAAAHSLLSRAGWTHMRLFDLLRSLTPGDVESAIMFTGDDVSIPPDRVTPVAMVFHELMTNSLKHGVLGAGRGRVCVHCAASASDKHVTRITVRWQELGGPMIELKPMPGAGTALIEGLTRADLGGEVRFNFPRSGADHELTLVLSQSMVRAGDGAC